MLLYHCRVIPKIFQQGFMYLFIILITGQRVVLAKKQFSPTVSFIASAREFSYDVFTISKGRRTNPS